MPPSRQPRVFISYARKDGAALAQRLQKDLNEQGFDGWLDTQRIAGGATWTNAIEVALDDAAYVLALLSPGSYVSEICRAEQLRSMRKGKCVIPLLAVRGSDVPLHLEAKNYRDFTTETGYGKAFDQLLDDLHARNGVELRQEFRDTYVTAPPLPVNFVERPEELAGLRDALINDDGGRHIALTALHGMGGIGKTVLAQALCHDDVVQQAFPDGIVWVSVGKESTYDLVTQLKEVATGLGDDPKNYENELRAINSYRNTIRKKAALIVVDDIWNARDIEPFRAESPRSRLLFTTRDASIAAAVGAREYLADLLSKTQSREMLSRWSGMGVSKLPPIAAELIAECGRLPLSLAMVGAMLRGKPAASWKMALGHLRKADLNKIKAQFPDYPHPDLLRTIQVSVDALEETVQDRYIAMAVLPEEMAAAPQIQQCLWGVGAGEAAESAEQLISLSLAQREQSEGSIRLHDLQLDYVRAQYPNTRALDLILGSIRLSAHVIARDPSQFASQSVARLLPLNERSLVEPFLGKAIQGMRSPWIRLLSPSINPPGTSLLCTLEGHRGRVNGVAVAGTGNIALSASSDHTLKVWDTGTGRELHTLTGHADRVWGVAVSADGKRAVSASEDHTLKVWDVESGHELRSLLGHSAGVRAVTLSADGLLAVSTSSDHTLRIWHVEAGRAVHILKGHTAYLNGVAMSADGRLAVSASWGTLEVWDVDGGQRLRSIEAHTRPVNGVAMSADGRFAVSASTDHTLKVWDLQNARQLRILEGHSDALTSVAMSKDGRLVVSASRDKTLKVWDLASGDELRTLPGHSSWVRGVALNDDGRIVISASSDHTLKVWDVTRGSELQNLEFHHDRVLGVAVSENRRVAVSASLDQTLKVWDVETERQLRTLKGHSRPINGVSLSPDGKRAISASYDNSLKVWDVDGGTEICSLTGHSDAVTSVVMSRDGRFAISASLDKTLKVWDMHSRRPALTLCGHSDYIFGLALSRDGRICISSSYDNTLKVWNVADGRELRSLRGHSAAVRAVALDGEGRLAVSASYDNTLKVWDVESGSQVWTLEGHTDYVYGVALDSDGRRAVSASYDKSVRMWDLERGVCLASFTCEGPVHCCAMIDSRRFIAGDGLGRVHFLSLEEPKPKE